MSMTSPISGEEAELAARAMHDAAETGVPWDALSDPSRDFACKLARAAIAAVRAHDSDLNPMPRRGNVKGQT